LYIGKSVNLRARVLSHLRSADEAAMLAQSRRVDTYRTAGEIGALLLEAQWVKQHMPLYNIRLRRSRSLVAWRLSPDAAGAGQPPQLVDSGQHDFAHTSDLYGLYASRRAAQEDLRTLAAEHRLCLVVLGLEKPLRRGCFGRQLRQCDGVCTGDEPSAAHHARLFSALLAQQVQRWPYPGAVDIIERDGDWVQAHRVHNWCYLGSHTRQGQPPDTPQAVVPPTPHGATPTPTPTPASASASASAPTVPAASATSARFDLDTYKILVKPLLGGGVAVQAVG
jgi:excinuclease Cho